MIFLFAWSQGTMKAACFSDRISVCGPSLVQVLGTEHFVSDAYLVPRTFVPSTWYPRYQVLGIKTWYQVLGMTYLVPSTWCQVLGTVVKYLVASTWYQVLGTKYLVPSTWYQVLGTKYLGPSTWYQVSGTNYPVPNSWYQ